ncbi:MAG TPA: MBL fold metallo-hydrolase [Polyangia bacterium]|jgi:glyoxylase-like metal-dependent hydrolase (beta-lactamase superfamily II)|nr:MBL fold metallo-hydrolase [Polyangia bacterium]
MCPWPASLINGGASGWLERGQMVCHCLLVETADGLILVDTGFGMADVTDPHRLPASFVRMVGLQRRQEETAIAQVRALGFARSDVRHILPTHLDLDHAGGLPDFPDAQVHIFADEHAAAMQRSTAREQHRYLPMQWAHQPNWQIHRVDGERWFGFESVRAVGGTDDEVLIVPLPGHTRGHSGIAVRTSDGWILHAGDAYFSRDEIHAEPPSCPVGLEAFQRLVAMDGHARVANRDRLHALVQAHGDEVRVISAHCPRELAAATT